MIHMRVRHHDQYRGSALWVMIFLFTLGLSSFDFGLTFAADTQQANSEVLVAQGVIAYDEQRFDDARLLLSEALELNSTDARGLYYLGLTQLALKDPSEAVTALEAAQQLEPTDAAIGYQLGVAYFTVGQYDDATPLLEQAYQADPNSENLGYYVGLSRYRQKNYEQAVEAFNKSKTTDPNLQQLTTFYRGLSLGVLGLSDEASAELRQLEQVDGGLPFSGPAVQIQQAIAARRQTDEAKRLSLQVSVGGFYNDNAAVNPRDTTTPDANTNVLIDSLRDRKTKTPGLIGSLVANYAFFREGPFEATVNYAFLQTYNLKKDLDEFNIQSHLPGASLFYRGVVGSIPFQIGAQYTYNYIFLKDAGFTSSHSPTLTTSVVPPSFSLPGLGTVGNLTSLIGRWQKKDFFREPVENDIRFTSEQRDAYNNMFGAVHAFRFAQDKHILRVGYQYDNESAAGTAFSYKGHRLQAGVQMTLPFAGLIVRYDYDRYLRDYKNSQTLFRDDDGQFSRRDDTQQTHTAQLVFPFAEQWSVTAQYQRVLNKSNIPLYDYKQNVITGLLTWAY